MCIAQPQKYGKLGYVCTVVYDACTTKDLRKRIFWKKSKNN